MRAAVLDGNKVIASMDDAPQNLNEIKIATNFDDKGNAIKMRTYKVSRSKRNIAKSSRCQPISKIGLLWTFHCVENGEVKF